MKHSTLALIITLLTAFAGIAVGQNTSSNTNETSVVQRPAEQMTLRYMTDRTIQHRPRVLPEEWELYLEYRNILGLSDDQVSELQDIRIEYLRDTTDTRGELEIAEQELEDLLAADELNVTAISRKLSDVHEYEEELEVALVAAVAEAREVLTDEQLEQAANLRRRIMRSMMNDSGSTGGTMMQNRMR